MAKHEVQDSAKRFDVNTLAQEAADSIRATQEDHLTLIERLETEYGLDLEALVAVYGDDVLNGSIPASRNVLKRWQKLYELLATDKKYAAIATSQRALRAGCYGFGAKPQYRSNTQLVIFSNPNTAQVVSKSDESGSRKIVVRGGWCIPRLYKP